MRTYHKVKVVFVFFIQMQFVIMELTGKDGEVYMKRSPVLVSHMHHVAGKIVRNFNDPEGFPVTEFEFDLWQTMDNNLVQQPPVNVLDLLFIRYMHDYWVKPQCCQSKQYRVEIPHEDEFFDAMIRESDKVETYRKLFECFIQKPLILTALRNDVVMCWDFVGHKPSRISGACLMCDMGENRDCQVCNPHFMCALEIVHLSEWWNCIWLNLFISFLIELGGSPSRAKIVFTCNLNNRKFCYWKEGNTYHLNVFPMGFAHLL